MIDFTTVSREFQSLVERRRELLTLLGSVFAGLGIFLQNGLQGNLPPSLATVESHLFAFVALILMVTSLILALRMARLHGGMVLNGVLFARLMQDQEFTTRGNPQRAARHNYAGASFLQFVLVDLIAAFSSAVLALTVGAPGPLAAALAAGVFAAWLGGYFRFHDRAARFALAKIAAEPCGPFSREDWEAHTSESLKNTNNDLLNSIAFVGLMLFSALETLSSLGSRELHGGDLRTEDITRYGPVIYTGLMVITCLLQLIIYIRLRIALGGFSLALDPTDRPFRPFRLTDSFLGYLLLAFLLAVSVHLFVDVVVPPLRGEWRISLAIDAAALVLATLAEPLTLMWYARQEKRYSREEGESSLTG
jgi:hypothetical protein